MESLIYDERCIVAVPRIKVRYGWVIIDGISLILITVFLCLAVYLPRNNDAKMPESEQINQPVTETISPGNIQYVTVTATPAYNADTKTPDN